VLHAAGNELAAAVTRSHPASLASPRQQSGRARMANKFFKPHVKPKRPF